MSGSRGLGPGEKPGDPLGGIARQHQVALAEEADALAGGGEKFGERQQEDHAAVALADGREPRAEIHRGGEVEPEPDRVGGLPLLLANIEMIVAGGPAPVDAGGRVAAGEGPELPERLAATGGAASVPAGDDRRGNAARLDEEVGKAGGEALRLRQGTAYRAWLRARRSHHCQLIFAFSSAITSRTVMPSARAAKERAMRCCSTGSASAITSSREGA